MAMRKPTNTDDGLMAEINITPLVDVMLVLLVIFIVTAPLIVPQSMPVKLPSTEAVGQTNTPHPVQLQISAEGHIELNGQAVTWAQLGPALRQHTAQTNVALQVLADERVAYGVVAKVMAVAQSQGAQQLSFVTLPLSSTAGGAEVKRP